MANIRNSIALTDRMTPTLRSILKAMDSTLRVMKDLDRAANNGAQSKAYKRAEKDIKRANNALIKMDNYTQMAGRSATHAASQYGSLSRAVSSVSNGMRAVGTSAHFFLQSLASGVYLAQKLANIVGGIMTTADISRSQVARLGLYNTSVYTNEELYGQIMRTAMGTRSGLTETADLANKILISGVYSGEGAVVAAINTAGIINKALIAGGGTAEENQRALRQLTQGLASGVLQGDELRSIREQTPYFAQVLAEGLAQIDERFEGIGIGDLKELGAQGELTADRVVKAMWAMQDEIDEDFRKMPKTFGQAMTSLSNIWQYFLWMLSDADGPLGKINERLWQFVDYLQSPAGFELMESVAVGINFIATALSVAMGAIGDFVVFLQEHSAVAQALFIALGVAAVAAGISAAIAWISAAWPILLVITLVGLAAYYFLQAGYTAQEVVGAVAGFVMGAIAVIWDAILFIVMFIMMCVALIATAVVRVGEGIILVIQSIIQVIIWSVMNIVTILWFILTVIESVFLLAKANVQAFVIGVVGLFYGLAQTVLSILGLIASGIDAVFGGNLAETVEGWSSTLEGKFTAFVQENDPNKTLEEIGTAWEDFGAGVKEMFTSDEYNLYGEMGGVVHGAGGLIDGIWDLYGQGENALAGLMLDPSAMYDTGYDWGENLVNEIGDMQLGIPTDSVLDQFNADGVTINGGDLDSVGSINSDVDISEEDLKLLRDMAARDYLLQLQTITPVANVTFGDVRETADVGKIVEVIEQMVDEQMATALVS